MNQHNYIKTPLNQPFIENRADPFICFHNGRYYFTASVPEYDRIIIRTGETLSQLKEAEEVVVWEKHDQGIMSYHIWAPELHLIKGKWYLYFAAGEEDDVWAIRPYVLECQGTDPAADPWMERGKVIGADPFSFQDFSLDMTVFEHKEDLYCVWAEKVSVGKKISNLYIARMKTPWELDSQQVLLSSPDYSWERVDFRVNEGAAVLFHNDRIYMTYSASATGACYCVGLLSADISSDLLDPQSWKKEREPVMQTMEDAGLYGPGHNSFTQTEDGKEIMIYHARPYDEIVGDPLYDPNRHAYLAEVKWNGDMPEFIPMELE